MADSSSIINLSSWLQTPAGHALLAWEQSQLDRAVADVFGFHALQLGMPQLRGLRANRMPHRWLALDESWHGDMHPSAQASSASLLSRLNHPFNVEPHSGADALNWRAELVCDFDALPLDSQSLDLLVLPHALEWARDPHTALSEVHRVLMPEGHVVILGFNPTSLWGLRQRLGHLRRSLGMGRGQPLFMPRAGEFIGYRRLRDWLRLLSFDVVAAKFGCYRPPLNSAVWLQRCEWMESTGERWWPVFGAVYMVVAVKRVRGMRLVGLARTAKVRGQAAPAAVVHHRHQSSKLDQP